MLARLTLLLTVIHARKSIISVINEYHIRSAAFNVIDLDMDGLLSSEELSYASEQANRMFPGLNNTVTFHPFIKSEFMKTDITLDSIETVPDSVHEILNNDSNIEKYVNQARSSYCKSKGIFRVKKLTINKIRKKCFKDISSCQSMIEDCHENESRIELGQKIHNQMRPLLSCFACISGIVIYTLGLLVILSVFSVILLSALIVTSPFWIGVVFLVLIFDGIREQKGHQYENMESNLSDSGSERLYDYNGNFESKNMFFSNDELK